MSELFWVSLGSAAAAMVTVRYDIRRRRLSAVSFRGWSLLTLLDVCCVALTVGSAGGLILTCCLSLPLPWPKDVTAAAIVGCATLILFLWPEGRRQIQVQRPGGLVFSEWALLTGGILSVMSRTANRSELIAGMGLFLLGLLLLAAIVPPFVKGREEHRILHRLDTQGEFIQQEWATPTPECPYPERWRMLDAQSAEMEVLEFLKSLVIAYKPDFIVETGTFIGHSAMKMAEGLRSNGFGELLTVEFDEAVFKKAKENIDASGLADWIEARHASSLDLQIDRPIDLLYCDSDINIREQEVRRFLPKIRPRGLVLIHDASSSFKIVRDAAFRLEEEGLLSVLLLSTPRGLMLGQKRADRA